MVTIIMPRSYRPASNNPGGSHRLVLKGLVDSSAVHISLRLDNLLGRVVLSRGLRPCQRELTVQSLLIKLGLTNCKTYLTSKSTSQIPWEQGRTTTRQGAYAQ